MKLKFIPIIGTLGLLFGSANAGSLAPANLAALAGDTLVAIDNTATNGVASAGYFATGFDVGGAVASDDLVSLLANFTPLVTTQIGDTTGFVGGDVIGLYSTFLDYGAPGLLLNKELYTFLGDGATLGTSGLHGLVQSNQVIGPDSPAPDSNAMPLVDPGNPQIAPAPTYLIGSLGTGTIANLTPILGEGNDNVPMGTYNLALVPEPSALVLGLFGFVGLLRRRR